MAAIKKIIVHCSDSPDAYDIGVKEIKQWHTDPVPKGRGWSDIGYQYVIRRNGTVEIGRAHNGDSVLEGKEIGAHTLGQNSDSLGICVVGRKDFDYRQLLALVTLVKTLMKKYSIPFSAVYGHYEFEKGKTCPNMDITLLRKALAA